MSLPAALSKRAHDFGRDPVVNGNGLREVFLADEMERDSRTARFDVAAPKRCKSVGVIVTGITVITHAKQSTL